MSFSAVVFSTEVQDTDGDGLLDVWELATLAAPVLDPTGQPLPALGSMGADPLQRDLFVEVGYMGTTGISTMDFRLTDEISDPTGRTDAWHTERLVRFAPTAWAYQAPAACPPGGPVRGGLDA